MDIVDQIIFWTEISKEHPIVINKLAQLSNIKLPASIIRDSLRFSKNFQAIQNQAKKLNEIFEEQDDDNWKAYQQRGLQQEIYRLVRAFATTDRQWISLLHEISRYGREDEVFQTLIQHIIDEQTYAYNVIATGTY